MPCQFNFKTLNKWIKWFIDNYEFFELHPMDRNVAMAIKKEESIKEN
jgi:hypothetical protein